MVEAQKESEPPSENLSIFDEHENTIAIVNQVESSSDSSNSDKENSNVRNNSNKGASLQKNITPAIKKGKPKVGNSA